MAFIHVIGQDAVVAQLPKQLETADPENNFLREPISLIETLGFAPGTGFARLTLHLARMARSARALGISFDERRARTELAACVAAATESCRVRLLLDEDEGFSATVAPLPLSPPRWRYAISPLRVASSDALARHKTTWRSTLDDEQARLARLCGADEALFLNERGEVAEGSRTNVFIARGGKLLTPPLESGVLDGCLRRELIEQGRCEEVRLTPQDLEGADAVFLGNSLRGLIPAVAVGTERVAAGG